MRTFVENIQQVAGEGKESLASTLNSTNLMSEKIDGVSKTVEQNTQMLENVADYIGETSKTMDQIKTSADEVIVAMDSTSSDAQKLADYANLVNAEAVTSTEFVQKLSGIDEELSHIVKKMMSQLSGSGNTIPNNEYIQIIENAKTAHTNWVKKLGNMVEKMEIVPLQTDSNKCAFGHFYKAITIKNDELRKTWDKIDTIHENLHSLGDKAIVAIKNGDKLAAKEHYEKAYNLSKQVVGYLDECEKIVESYEKNHENVL